LRILAEVVVFVAETVEYFCAALLAAEGFFVVIVGVVRLKTFVSVGFGDFVVVFYLPVSSFGKVSAPPGPI
jgi:hypothetical protein